MKKKKGGLILGPIPKISPKHNFFKKTGYQIRYNRNRPITGTPVLTRSRFRFWFLKTRNWGTPVPVHDFSQKSGNWTGLTPLPLTVTTHNSWLNIKNLMLLSFCNF